MNLFDRHRINKDLLKKVFEIKLTEEEINTIYENEYLPPEIIKDAPEIIQGMFKDVLKEQKNNTDLKLPPITKEK